MKLSLRSDRKKRWRLLVAIAVLAGALILLFATEWASVPRTSSRDTIGPDAVQSSPPPAARATPGLTGGPTPARAFHAPRIPPPTADDGRSPLADKLHDPARTEREDVAIVAELFANHFEIFRAMPVGTNAEITAALAGDNARGHAPLPPDHTAINAAGELVDRHGTPYFFHQLSRDRIEIRGAGADRKHFTGDDVIWPEQTEFAGILR
jgi:hypothetical protein